ncbi:phytase domain protein [Cellvibrio japonicus Ueda107]|uniref:Phytase domain protein n=2 Tax=Cellvibrio japonicus TaxID=155077 RepID=B3PKT6_CELJU|nr:phytase domain protein [Cellvibrio japonicus Ueda107]QEI11497.1 phytase [Cellvibrio japonicus]QEI15071.1 phytase [Cellvibrio japonicus]QEI18651.1 phytase [Cellvibrio japonicus]
MSPVLWSNGEPMLKSVLWARWHYLAWIALLPVLLGSNPGLAETRLGQPFSARQAYIIPAQDGWGKTRLETGDALVWRDAQGQILARLNQATELLDVRQRGSELWIAAMALPEQQPALYVLDRVTRELREQVRLPLPSFKPENLCLSQDANRALSMYLLDERGMAEHWLVADGAGRTKPALIRTLPIPPNSKACSVEDTTEQLFVAEEAVGIWRYSASAEAAPGRVPVSLNKPFGELQGIVDALVAIPGGLLALDAETLQLLVYRQQEKHWVLQQVIPVSGLREAELLSASWEPATQQLQIVVGDKKTAQQYPLNLPWSRVEKTAAAAHGPTIVSVMPEVQTQSVARFGDAADDPAIWINQRKPHHSRVLGTNKQQGLLVYDLQGRELQRFDTGRLNNVDVRQGLRKGNKPVDIAIATNRDDNSLSLYEIDPRSGKLHFAASIPTSLKEIYGFCLYHSPVTGALYAIPNDKSGEFQQIRISARADAARQYQWQGELVRRFFVKTQPEGCVADDQRQRLFIGEEDVGIWTLAAEPSASGELTRVMAVGEQLVADVEGLAIYQHATHPYLVVSSQGNNSYLVLDAVAPYTLRGIFRIAMDIDKGIDGVSETDGLEVLSVNVGKPFEQGILVVQDGHNVMPESPQNFKYVSWEKIRAQLMLP